jgi:hypothetical protein
VQALGNLCELLDCLEAFAQDHFNFFYHGFSQVQGLHLVESWDYPVNYVFRVILDQVAHDIEIVRRAADQRLDGSEQENWALVWADELAKQALLPGAGLGLHGTRVVTYLKKSASVRVIPYARVALIGVPLTCVPSEDQQSGDMYIAAQDLLAIPHEAGHYVFWHGASGNGRRLERELRDRLIREELGLPKWARRWAEEIFADVYGCLIAGPMIAFDFQDLQRETSVDDFVTEDGRHPSPLLRPDIYTEVLRWMQDPQSAAWADAAASEWQAYLDSREHPDRFELSEASMPEGYLYQVAGALFPRAFRWVRLVEAEPSIKLVIDEVLNLLGNISSSWWLAGLPGVPQADAPSSANEPGPPEPAEILYQHLADKLSNTQPGPRIRVETVITGGEDPLCRPWHDWVAAEGFFPDTVDGQAPTGRPIPVESEGDSPASAWLPVLDAAGWSTEGPDTGIDQGG